MATFHRARLGSTTVAVPRLAGTTSLTVLDGSQVGSQLPAYAIAVRGATRLCILEITARVGNVLTVAGAVDGTTDQAMIVGDSLRFGPTPGALNELQDAHNALEATVAAGGSGTPGVIGDGTLHPLSERYGSLAAAQAVYPRARSLGESIDRHAIQKALDAAIGGTVRLGAGDFRLDYPLVLRGPVGTNTTVAGLGPGTTRLVMATPFLHPVLVAVPDLSDIAPVTGAGLAFPTSGPVGWVNFADLGGSFYDAPTALTLDLTVTTPNLGALAPGEYVLIGSGGGIQYNTFDHAFALAVTQAGLLRMTLVTVGEGSVRHESTAGALPGSATSRVVATYGSGRLTVWVRSGGVSTKVIDVARTGAVVQQRWEDVVIGYQPLRWPDGGGFQVPPPGIVYRAAYVSTLAGDPLAAPTVDVSPDAGLGWYCGFASHDGCLIPASKNGGTIPGTLIWRTGDYLGLRTSQFRDFRVEGGSHGLVLINNNNWMISGLAITAVVVYGIFGLSQNFGGTIDSCSVNAGRIGILLANNSGLVHVRDTHVSGCLFGVIMSDSAGVLSGSWVDSCSVAELVVKGDGATVAATGISFGIEGGSPAPWGVLLSGVVGAAFTGCSFNFPGTTNPPVTMVDCVGGAFTGCNFGPGPAAPACLAISGQDATRPVAVVGEGRRWRAGDVVPLTDSPGSVVVLAASSASGSPGAIQYNNAGALGGFGSWAGGTLTVNGTTINANGTITINSAVAVAVNGLNLFGSAADFIQFNVGRNDTTCLTFQYYVPSQTASLINPGGDLIFKSASVTWYRGFAIEQVMQLDTAGNLGLWKSTTVGDRQAAGLVRSWVDPTDASRKGRLALNAYDSGGARECFRGEADGAQARVGFLGAAAVARPAGDVPAALQALGLVTSPTVAVAEKATFHLAFGVDLTTGVNKTVVGVLASAAGNLWKWKARAATNPGTGGFTFDLKRNGTSVLAAPVAVAAGVTTAQAGSSFVATTITEGDEFTVDVTACGTGVQYLVIFLYYLVKNI